MAHFSRDGWRGGWETTVNGSERILELRIRGDVVSGVSWETITADKLARSAAGSSTDPSVVTAVNGGAQ